VAARDELLTERLRLRRWRPADAAPIAAINRDPEVARFLNNPAAQEGFYERALDHWSTHGFGWWAVERLGDARFIGFVGVAYPTFLPEVADTPELGWRLASAAWGRGYATEAAIAARDDAFARLGLPSLISIIHPENARSQRVARKLGMSVGRRVHHAARGLDVDIWETGLRPAPRAARAGRDGRRR